MSTPKKTKPSASTSDDLAALARFARSQEMALDIHYDGLHDEWTGRLGNIRKLAGWVNTRTYHAMLRKLRATSARWLEDAR